MDAQKDTLICRLCGINLIEGKYKSIFEGSTDLMHKIKETLPISISIDDNGSKYVCLPCYDKTTLYYKFIQEVVEYSKGLENVPQLKSFFDLTKEVTEFSQIHSDAVYTCPNCNVDLVILLVSNPQGCDYTFQISLAMVNHSDKKHSLVKEKSIHLRENLTHLNNSKSSEQSKNANKIAPIGDIENISNKDIENISIKGIENISNPMKLSENASLIVEKVDVEKKLKRRLEESDSHDPFIRSSKILKLDEISNENLPSCDYVSRLLLAKNESKNSLLAKTDLESDNIYWLDSEMDCKSEKEAYAIESQREDDLYKSYMKYVCKLCGARYHSHLKYEFHMERHKAGKMDKYECTMCEKETSKENLLWDHYYHTHKSLQRFICMECGKIFAKRSRLNGHQKTNKHSGVKQIQVAENDDAINEEVVEKVTITQQEKITVNCNLCGKLISDLDPDAINDLVTCADCEDSTLSLMVDGNETKVISPRQYHCSMCPKHFVRKERLEFHEMRHNENMNEFICSTCGKDFRAENSLYEHYLFVHKGARPHICELCGKSFQLKARLKEHHRIHTGERPFQCDICGKRCRTTNALKLHRKIHFSHNRYACNVCSKSFSKKQNMNEHLEKHWKNDKTVSLPQLFTCPICEEDFPTYRMLKYHMIEVHEVSNQDPILTKQKPWYECAECHEKFKHQMSLKAHKERVHEGRVDPNYQCDLCNATYRVKQLLVNHIKSKHNGERRYKCAQCEKGFNDTKSLYNHVLLHTGKKPFVCEYCNMSFRRKDSRDHHRRKHTGEQPYQCPDCGESFSTYNNRSKHRKREHCERDPECPEYGEKCSNQQEIKIHLNKHLGEKLKRLQNIKSDEA